MSFLETNKIYIIEREVSIMATKKNVKEETKVENIVEETTEEKVEETVSEEKSEAGSTEPEVKESRWDKIKKFGKEKALPVAKKAVKAAGLIAVGAGATLGVLAVMTKPDGTEYEALPENDDLVPADEFIEGEAEIVEDGTEE